MPYPNFHAFRIRDPGDFDHIVMLEETPNGIQIYGGPLKSDPKGGTKAQTYRFPRGKFTFSEARNWMQDHNLKYIDADEATGKEASLNQFEDSMMMAVWTAKEVNDLSDSAFLYIESGGEKDSEDKTIPRDLRHFPYKDSSGNIDLPHLRNAIARIPQSNLPQSVKDKVQAHAQKLLDEENTKKSASYAGYALNTEPVICLAVGDTKMVDGVIHKFFKKDILKVGHYKHPTEGWELDVTPEKLQQYKKTFDLMTKNGVKVEIPTDHSSSAKDNLGYVIEMSVEPDEKGIPTIYGLHEVIGDESIGICQRCPRVSATIHKDYVDGKGNRYGEAIINSSVVQQPIVPGQSDFIPVKIAASMFGGASKIPVLYLNLQGDKVMDKTVLAKFGELLGATDITEQNLVEKVGGKIKELSRQITTLTEDIKKLSTKPADKKPEEKADPNIIEPLATMAETRLSLLVEKGKITPAVKKELSEILVGAAGSRNIMTLSFGQEGKQSLLFQLCNALDKNDVIQLGQQTGIQSFERPIDDSKAKEEKATTEKMVKQVG
jgi:hypothetical protein